MFDKKQAVLGLTSLLRVPIGDLPVPLRDGVDQILIKLLEVLHNLMRQREEVAAAAEEDEEDGEEDEEDGEDDEDDCIEFDGDGGGKDDEGFNDDDDAADPKEQAYMKEVMKMRQQVAEQQFRVGVGGLLDDDDYGEDSDDDENEDDTSALDGVDELVFFHDVLQEANVRDAASFGAVHAKMPLQVQQACQQLLEAAAARKEAKAAEAASVPQ